MKIIQITTIHSMATSREIKIIYNMVRNKVWVVLLGTFCSDVMNMKGKHFKVYVNRLLRFEKNVKNIFFTPNVFGYVTWNKSILFFWPNLDYIQDL